MRTSAEVIDLLSNVQWHEQKLAVVEITAAFKNSRDGQLHWEDHLVVWSGAGLFALLFNTIEFLEDLIDVAWRENVDLVSNISAKSSRQLRTQYCLVTIKVKGTRNDEVTDVGGLAFEVGINTTDLWGHPSVLKLDQDRSLDERSDCCDL